MTLGDLKRYLLTHLIITRLHEMAVRDVVLFDQRWNTFKPELRIDNNTVTSWYLL